MATPAFHFTKIRLEVTTGQRLSRLSYKTAHVAPGAETAAKAILMGHHLVWSQAEASLAFSGNARASGLKVKVVSHCKERGTSFTVRVSSVDEPGGVCTGAGVYLAEGRTERKRMAWARGGIPQICTKLHNGEESPHPAPYYTSFQDPQPTEANLNRSGL